MRPANDIIAWLEDAGLAGLADDAAGDTYSLEDVAEPHSHHHLVQARDAVWAALAAHISQASIAECWGVDPGRVCDRIRTHRQRGAQSALLDVGPSDDDDVEVESGGHGVWQQRATMLLPFIAAGGMGGRSWRELIDWGRARRWTGSLVRHTVAWLDNVGRTARLSAGVVAVLEGDFVSRRPDLRAYCEPDYSRAEAAYPNYEGC